jgi:hypothetical protein
MVTLARRASRIPFAPVVAILFGIVAAILVAAVPQWLFERGVVASGLPHFIAAATPPLGLLARLLAVATAFLAISVLLWAILGPLTSRLEGRVRARTPWRDAGYDTPIPEDSDLFISPRKPIFAPEELGAPLMSDEAIATVPDAAPELDRPVMAEELAPEPLVSPNLESSIAALIRRLEDGLARRKDSGPDSPGGAAAPLVEPLVQDDVVAPPPGFLDDAADDTPVRGAMNMFRRRAFG